MTGPDSATGKLPPVERLFSVRRSPEEAFTAFTDRIGDWWPAGFTGAGDRLAAVAIEPKAGGRVYETDTEGGEQAWGSVVRYEPGHRLTLSWGLGLDSGSATEVDVVFNGVQDGCAVRFVHGGFDAGQEKDRAKFDDEGGWNVVLGHYRRYADGSSTSD